VSDTTPIRPHGGGAVRVARSITITRPGYAPALSAGPYPPHAKRAAPREGVPPASVSSGGA
jgi:hypothetical protein